MTQAPLGEDYQPTGYFQCDLEDRRSSEHVGGSSYDNLLVLGSEEGGRVAQPPPPPLALHEQEQLHQPEAPPKPTRSELDELPHPVTDAPAPQPRRPPNQNWPAGYRRTSYYEEGLEAHYHEQQPEQEAENGALY